MRSWGGFHGAGTRSASGAAGFSIALRSKFIRIVAAGLFMAPLFGLASATAGTTPDTPVATSRAVNAVDDGAFVALRNLSQTLQTEKAGGEFKVAADSLFEALRDRANGVSSEPAPAARPVAVGKPVKGRVTKSDPVGEADFVGSKSCVECHAKKIADFNKTLMGRLL